MVRDKQGCYKAVFRLCLHLICLLLPFTNRERESDIKSRDAHLLQGITIAEISVRCSRQRCTKVINIFIEFTHV